MTINYRKKNEMKEERNTARADKLMHKIERFVLAQPEDKDYDRMQMTPAQVQATQVILKKLVPDLSSVEQTIVDENEKLSEEQILASMAQMVEASPDLAAKLRSMLKPALVDEEKQA